MALPALDPVIHQATRLRIMSLLFRNRTASFTWTRDTLGLTDGNLDAHAARLESAGYVRRGRALLPGGFQVRLRITPEGDVAFRRYLEALRAYLSLGTQGGVPGLAVQDSKGERLGPDDQEREGHAVHEMGEDAHPEGDPTEFS